MTEHRVDTQGAHPIRQQLRRQPHSLLPEIQAQTRSMLEREVISPSSSHWASPIVLVKKRNGTYRFCVDYRHLNVVTVKDSYPLPQINQSLDSLDGATKFTTLDLASGYWQVPVASEDRTKTAFSTATGLYEFNVLQFGLANAPSTFQRLMDMVLVGLQGEQCLVYLDDVIVFGSTYDLHLERLERVFERLQKAGLKLHQKKFSLRTHQSGIWVPCFLKRTWITDRPCGASGQVPPCHPTHRM